MPTFASLPSRIGVKWQIHFRYLGFKYFIQVKKGIGCEIVRTAFNDEAHAGSRVTLYLDPPPIANWAVTHEFAARCL